MFKKTGLGILILAGISFITVKTGFSGISGSEHDFSTKSWNTSGQKCNVCHTPHNATSAIAPLWNHVLTTATFTLYSSPSLNATVPQPTSSSKACLSCHDGTVALDSFGGNTGTAFMTGSEKLGTDLSNDHPVSLKYDAALATADGGIADPTTKTVAALGGKTINAGMLIGGNLECGSCHDVHRTKGDSPTAGKLLLVNNSGSGLCLTCHNK